MGASLSDEIDPATARSLIPTLGTLRLSGLSLDGTADDEGRKVKVQASFKGFELTADKPVNAIPTNIRIELQNFAMVLPPKSSDDGIKELVASATRLSTSRFSRPPPGMRRQTKSP